MLSRQKINKNASQGLLKGIFRLVGAIGVEPMTLCL